ncbi:hypothetical protein D9758_013182 [Tetrapyrgos nigripes]|uniref:Uncharacterized protein n=1 Tax=Tetrapyrgos nigripes TaxID=182062 RepID=A0A8H5CRH3_9AGAR|nr:hypothetical protein D9758_013183 [Tetrapyrgos nigripes]KAF5346671.1 hypothetical protein D9758_013182 [Tetrapyrgos nigripes]
MSGNRVPDSRTISMSGGQYKENDHSSSVVHGRSTTNFGAYTENSPTSSESLPEDIRTSFVKEVKAVVIELAGCGNAWEDPTSEKLKGIWIKVMPNMRDDFSRYEQDIRSLVAKILIEWRDSIGNAAIAAVKSDMEKEASNSHRRIYVMNQTKGDLWNHLCYYSDRKQGDGRKPAGFLQSPVVAKTFSEHFKVTLSIPQTDRLKNQPTGAMVLTILAIDRAFKLFANGHLENIPQGDFSQDAQARSSAPIVQQYFGKTGKGQERVDTELWEKIKAAAKSHVKTPYVEAVDVADNKGKLPDDLKFC